MDIALYQPDIPQNLGSVLRLSACMGVICHVIEPCGFVLDDKRLARVAMDYIDQVKWQRHASWDAFLQLARSRAQRVALFSTKAQQSLYDFTFTQSDILLFGRESAGVPPEVAAACDARLRVPMPGGARSLNIVQAVSMAIGEAHRQLRALS